MSIGLYKFNSSGIFISKQCLLIKVCRVCCLYICSPQNCVFFCFSMYTQPVHSVLWQSLDSHVQREDDCLCFANSCYFKDIQELFHLPFPEYMKPVRALTGPWPNIDILHIKLGIKFLWVHWFLSLLRGLSLSVLMWKESYLIILFGVNITGSLCV